MTRSTSKIRPSMLLILAVVIMLGMLRLGVWQLDRADQKQVILDTLVSRSGMPPTDIGTLLDSINNDEHRFRPVSAIGRYLPAESIYVDNQVVAGKVGYRVFTPLKITGYEAVILVNRGWLPVGQSREQLPQFDTPTASMRLTGRLNTAPAQPPLWDSDYPVSQGQVWAYLPLSELADQMQLNIIPLVLELAPEKDAAQILPSKPRPSEAPSTQDFTDHEFVRVWSGIDDEWVAKHKGYAFQWFTMAVVFFLACLVLLVRTLARNQKSQ